MPNEMDKNKLTKLSALEDLARRAKAASDAVDRRVSALEEIVPTKVSQLTNDSKYQTETDVAAAVAGADHLKRKIVTSVDAIDKTAADAAQYIYMVLKSSTNIIVEVLKRLTWEKLPTNILPSRWPWR